MLWRGNQNQLVPMDEYHRQARVRHGKGNDSKVNRVVDDRFEDLSVVRALDVHRNIRILFLEVGEHIGQDVQAGALVRAYYDFAPGHTLHLGDRHEHRLPSIQRFLDILLKSLARGGERNLATGTVEELRPDFFFQPANLRRNRGLRAKTLLRAPRERGVPRHFEKGFELVKIHSRSWLEPSLNHRGHRVHRGTRIVPPCPPCPPCPLWLELCRPSV